MFVLIQKYWQMSRFVYIQTAGSNHLITGTESFVDADSDGSIELAHDGVLIPVTGGMTAYVRNQTAQTKIGLWVAFSTSNPNGPNSEH
jgi:hypothetical protein